MHRRIALKLLGGALVAASAAPAVARAQQVGGTFPASGSQPWTVIGFSQGGLPLVVHHVGTGTQRLFIMGGQHGGPEENTIQLAQALLDTFKQPGQLPSNVGLDVLVVANPDGEAAGIRQFLSGVDPNRNWPGSNWERDAYDSNGAFRRGLGGPEPFSEQETRALRDWRIDRRPTFSINYHSAGGFMFGPTEGPGAELTLAFAEASGYLLPRSGGGASGLLGYRTSGTMNGWMRTENLLGIFIELTTPRSPEFDRNLAGVQAILARLAST
jgi:hypothetical protein